MLGTLMVRGQLRTDDMLRTIFSMRAGFSISDDPAHLRSRRSAAVEDARDPPLGCVGSEQPQSPHASQHCAAARLMPAW